MDVCGAEEAENECAQLKGVFRGLKRRWDAPKKGSRDHHGKTSAKLPCISSESETYSSGVGESNTSPLGCTGDSAADRLEEPGDNFWLPPDCAGASAADRSPPGDKMIDLATELWAVDYQGAMAKEKERYEASGQLRALRGLIGPAPASSYLRQRRTSKLKPPAKLKTTPWQ